MNFSKFVQMSSHLVGALSVAAFSINANANTVVFDNFGANSSFNYSVGAAIYQSFGYSGSDSQEGYMFNPSSTGALQSVIVPVFTMSWQSPLFEHNHGRLSIYDTIDGHPGNALASADFTAQLYDQQAMVTTTVNFGGSVVLNQGQSYWLIMDALDANSVLSWQYITNYYNTNATRASRDGGDWSLTYGNGGESAYRISVSSVPVPAAAWLLGSGFLCLVGVARRKAA